MSLASAGNREQPNAPASHAFTKLELRILDQLVPAGASQPAKAIDSTYLLKLARLGGYLARARDGPPGNTVIWRGLSRLSDIELGLRWGENLWVTERFAGRVQRGHLTAAIALMAKLARHVPRPEFWQVLGNYRDEAGDTEGAERAYRSVLDLDPTWARAHVGLGHLKRDAGDLVGAEAAYRTSLDLEETGLTHEFLGFVLGHQGRHEDAIRHFERSIEMDDTNGEAFLNLARMIEETDPDRSVQLLKKALDLGDERAEPDLERLGH